MTQMLQTLGMSHLSMNAFRDAQCSTPVGSFFVYAVGDLALTKWQASRDGHRNAAELLGIAGLALEGWEAGRLFLCQRREGPHTFSYLAGMLRAFR